ncbi:unnamed protein product, partial [marine sediment metagenome]
LFAAVGSVGGEMVSQIQDNRYDIEIADAIRKVPKPWWIIGNLKQYDLLKSREVESAIVDAVDVICSGLESEEGEFVLVTILRISKLTTHDMIRKSVAVLIQNAQNPERIVREVISTRNLMDSDYIIQAIAHSLP